MVINEEINVVDVKDCPDDVDFVNFSFLKKDYPQNNPALRIYFKNDLNYNARIISQLIEFQKKGISFLTEYNGKKVSYIISNYPDDVLYAFEALNIADTRERIVFLYNTIYSQLDSVWKNINPCGFCKNVCEGNKHRQSPKEIDGCCYSFEYPKHILFSNGFITNLQKCVHFDTDRKCCSIRNLSCKFFVCNYIKKTTSFNIDIDDFLLVKAFFTKKQRLILKYNYFRTEDEIIEKLLETNSVPYLIYYWKSLYRIPANKKNN